MFKRFIKNGQEFLDKESSSILSAAIVIMGATLLSAVLGLIRTRLLISYFYADKAVVDVFWAAFRLPDMVFQIIIVGALSSAFIPVFTRYLNQNGESNRIASTMINWVMFIMIILSVLIFIFARPLSGIIAGGFNQGSLELMANLTRIMAVAQVFFGFSSFLTGIIQSHKRFLVPALSPILYNFGIIIGIVVLGPRMGIYGPAIGVVIGAVLHLLAQLPLAQKLGFRYSLIFSSHPAIKEMGALMLPRMLTLSLVQLESTAIVTFSTWLASGTVTIMSIAMQLSSLPVRLIGIPIGQASLPFFSRENNEGGLTALAGIVNKTVLEMLYLALPASVIILILRVPFVRLAYGADSFPWAETVTTGKLVAILAISIAARSLTHILVRVYYALHDTKTPFVINLLSTIINISLSYYFLFVLQAGIIGMAVAITLAALVETFVLMAALYKKAQFSLTNLLVPFGKMLFVTSITGLALWGPLRLLDQVIFDTTRTVPLIFLTLTVSIIGLFVYLALSYLMEIEELAVFVRMGEKLKGWRKSLGLTSEPLESQESSV